MMLERLVNRLEDEELLLQDILDTDSDELCLVLAHLGSFWVGQRAHLGLTEGRERPWENPSFSLRDMYIIGSLHVRPPCIHRALYTSAPI